MLGLAGTIPFVIGAILSFTPEIAMGLLSLSAPTAQLLGPLILFAYGTVIFAFMAGVLWGFAAKAPQEQAGTYYVLSVIPAIAMFFLGLYGAFGPIIGLEPLTLLPMLVAFVVLLALDFVFLRAGLAPEWWMKLRLPITAIVSACLFVGYHWS